MGNKKSIFLSALVGALTGCMITMMAIPYILQHSGIGQEISEQMRQIQKEDSVQKPTYVQTSTDNVYKFVAKKAMPSVVGVQTTTQVRDGFWGFSYPATGVGTGIIVKESGYILTNYHVVEGAEKEQTTILLSDGTKEKGKVIWGDAGLDLAVVKINKTGLTAAVLGDSDVLEVGDLAIAIGNPLGLDYERSMTEGIISGLNRSLTIGNHTMENLIQTSAAINRGNSGGPLLNANGEVIGINTLKEGSGEALGFAIPINQAKNIVEQVISTGKVDKVFLGIEGKDIYYVERLVGDDYGAKDGGVFIFSIAENSVAEKSGLKAQDVIIKIDDTDIKGMEDLLRKLYFYKKGDKAKITIIRDGKEKKIDVTFE